MTQDDIRNWALRHGFVPVQNHLECPYMEFVVRIEFLTRNVRVSIAHPTRGSTVLASAAPGGSGAFIDEDDLLQGFGLSGSFFQRFVGRPEFECPPWFSKPFRDFWDEMRRASPAPGP